MAIKKNILVVAAHPDDEVLGCGATMAKHVAEGDHVTLVLVADGVTSRMYDPTHPMARRKELSLNKQAISRRAKEAYHAAKVLGLGAKNVCLLNLADQRLDNYLLLDIVKHIEKIKRSIKPSVVYTHFWGDLNLDHQIVCRAVLTAFRPRPGEHHAEVLHFEIPESTYLSVPGMQRAFIPDHYVDVQKTFSLKLKALESYESERRQYPDFRSIKFIEKLGKKRGQEFKIGLAEAFVRLPVLEYDP